MEFHFVLTLTAGPYMTSFVKTMRWTKGVPSEDDLFKFIYDDCVKAFRATWPMMTGDPIISFYRCVPNVTPPLGENILSWS